MGWVESIHKVTKYIEENLRGDLNIHDISRQAALSPFYFQKGFAMLCGMTVGEYIRQRRGIASIPIRLQSTKDVKFSMVRIFEI